MVIIALGLGLRKREQLNLRRDQIDFFRNVVIASRTKGKRNREIPMDVLDERVKPILMSLCGTKKADEFVFVNRKTKKLYTDIKKAFASACKKAGVRDLEWHDLRGYVLHAPGIGWLRCLYYQGAHGPQRYESHGAVHSRKPIDQRSGISTCPQIGHK
jgi:integrase